jgi:hypothetical protein
LLDGRATKASRVFSGRVFGDRKIPVCRFGASLSVIILGNLHAIAPSVFSDLMDKYNCLECGDNGK